MANRGYLGWHGICYVYAGSCYRCQIPLDPYGDWFKENTGVATGAALFWKGNTVANATATEYTTREDWLNAFINAARPVFEAANAPLPINVRVSVGFTSKGFKGSRIGECWSDLASEDGHFEIFIKPTLDGAARICDVLSHELVHAAVGLEASHGPVFKRVALAIGLTGKMTATVAGPDWYTWALPIIESLGPLPYGALNGGGMTTGRPKQKTALLKAECPACGFIARVTAKHVTPHSHLNCPVPDCLGELIVDGAGDPE